MKKPSKILIIGAGIAGLAAARILIADNYDVLILEARDRIGGRTWTQNFYGVPFDIGAFIFHGTQNNPIMDLAHQFKVRYKSLDNPSYLANSQRPYSADQLDFFEELFNSLLKEASDYAMQAPTDISLAKAIEQIRHKKKYSAMPAEIFDWQASFLPLWSGADTDQLSARNWNRDETPLEGGNHLVVDGYRPIVESLARGLQIKLNTIITKIDYSDEGVKVYSDNAQFHADKIIVTVPLGILKKQSITFNPPLPKDKSKSIQLLAMGVLDKIILKFTNQFWQSDIPSFTFLESHDTPYSRFINGSYFFNQPVFITGAGGHYASDFENLDLTRVQQLVMDNLRKCFGNAIPDPSAALRTRWQQDIFSHGSYSYIPIGGSGEDYDALAQPVADKIFFAGEATHRQHPGTVHGAYLSGLREAERITGNNRVK